MKKKNDKNVEDIGDIAEIEKVVSKEDRMEKFRKMINKKHGSQIAYDLTEENPTEVREWIPTGSRILDMNICKGKHAGIPSGKIVEIAGLPSSGKSYLAAQIASNADQMGFDVIWFDSESSIDPTFIEKMGVELKNFLYIQAVSVENVLENIEMLLEDPVKKIFIWDSISMTACDGDKEGDFDPQSGKIAEKPRILSKAFKKICIPLANSGSVLLILNQLYTNITSDRFAAMSEPYKASGGQALRHSYSLSIWLTASKGKDSYIMDDKERVIGSQVLARIEKSRFGTYKRKVSFKILWGTGDVRICDQDSWLEPIKQSPFVRSAGGWRYLKHEDGSEETFQEKDWLIKLQDPKFGDRVLQILDEIYLHETVKLIPDEEE